MKKVAYCILLCVLFAVQPVKANQPISQWFASMPDSVMSLLTRNNRLDLIDFNLCNMEAIVTNRMDGKSRMSILADDYLHINYTASTDVEMKLLAINDSTDVICVVTTANGVIKDSRICFYDEEWNSLDVNLFFIKPTLKDFYPIEINKIAETALDKVDIFFCTYHLAVDSSVLKCRLSSIDYLFLDDKDSIMSHLEGQSLITYSWLEGKFCKDE